MTELPAWVPIVLGGGGSAAIIGSLLVFYATRKRDKDSDIAGRFEDATEMNKYIDARVEAIVAPIREKMAKVEQSQKEMTRAVAARETQLWFWDQRGRVGELPMLPGPILEQLGLSHLGDGWPTERPK